MDGNFRVLNIEYHVSCKCDNFISPLSICIYFISFSCLIAMDRASSTILNNSDQKKIKVTWMGILVFFLNSGGRLSALHHWILCWPWFCHKWPLSCWDMFPLYPLWWGFLLWMDTEFYQSISWHRLRWSCGFSFILLVWCITLIDLCMLNHPCDPGVNPIWSWCMIFLMYCWIQFANILLRICASIFIKDVGL